MRFNLLLALLLFGSNVHAQHPILSSFNFNNTAEGMALSFVIAGGNTCNGIDVFHKVGDTGIFKLTGQIPGICGHSSNDTRYGYLHENPNAFDTNYYYLDFGGVGPSDPVMIYYVPFKGAKMVISQRPQHLTIFIDDPSFNDSEVLVYDLQGRSVSSAITSVGQAQIALPHLSNELLIVFVKNTEQQVLVQKVLMLR